MIRTNFEHKKRRDYENTDIQDRLDHDRKVEELTEKLLDGQITFDEYYDAVSVYNFQIDLRRVST